MGKREEGRGEVGWVEGRKRGIGGEQAVEGLRVLNSRLQLTASTDKLLCN